MRTETLRSAAIGASLALIVAPTTTRAAGPLLIFDPASRTPFAYGPGTVNAYTDLGDLGPELTNTEADGLAVQSFADWTNVASSSFAAGVAGDFASVGLPDITASNASLVIGADNNPDGIYVVYDHDGQILANVLGAPPGVLGFATPERAAGATITESVVVLNGTSVHADDPAGTRFRGVFTHEFGHSINLAHTQTNGAIILGAGEKGPSTCLGSLPYAGSPAIAQIETMYPFVDLTASGTAEAAATVDRVDDVASLSDLYPGPGWPGSHGRIGIVVQGPGSNGIDGVNVVARSRSDPFGACTSQLSGAFSLGADAPNDGFVSLTGLPAGEYVVYVEAITDGGFSTPPVELAPEQEEFQNNVLESSDPGSDLPCDFESFGVVAGSSHAAVVILNVPSLATAQPNVCYGSLGRTGEGDIVTIDTGTGDATVLGPSGLDDASGLAIDAGGEIYATGRSGGLHRVDAISGKSWLVASTATPFSGVAFDRRGQLYGLSQMRNDPHSLYRIDKITGARTLVGDTNQRLGGMTFDLISRTMFASTTAADPGKLYTVDLATGGTTLVGSTGSSVIGALHVDRDGNLFGTERDQGPSNLVAIDKGTAAVTPIGPTKVLGVSGLDVWICPHQLDIQGFTNDFIELPMGGSTTRAVDIRNLGDPGCAPDLEWAFFVLPGCEGLTVPIPSGTTAPGQTTSQALQFDSFGLAPGTYTCEIQFLSNDPAAPSLTRNVEMVITGSVARTTPGVCYGSLGTFGNGSLVTIDPATGAGTVLGPSGAAQLPAMAIHPDGHIFAMDAPGNIYRLDAATGAAVFEVAADIRTLGMEFSADGTLHATGWTQQTLYTIDMTTGQSTLIGGLVYFFGDLAFDPTTGELYGSTSPPSDNEIWVIDPSNAALTRLVVTGQPFPISAIHFDATGQLWGARGGGQKNPNVLLRIDKQTGDVIEVGPMGFSAVSAMDVYCPPDVHVGVASIEANIPLNGEIVFDLPITNLAPVSCSLSFSISEEEPIDGARAVGRPARFVPAHIAAAARKYLGPETAGARALETSSLAPASERGTAVPDGAGERRAPPVSLVLDDGSADSAVGDGAPFLWFNRFTPAPAEFPFRLSEVSILFTNDASAGGPIDIYVWEDIDGDGNPLTSATVLGALTGRSVLFADGVTVSTYPFPPVVLAGPGDVLVGVVSRGAVPAPGPVDGSTDEERSWIGFSTGSGIGDPPALPADGSVLPLSVFVEADWVLRGAGVRTTDCTWLSETPMAMNALPGGGTTTVEVYVNATGLPPGEHTCNLVVQTNDPDEPAVVVPVNVTIRDVITPARIDVCYATTGTNDGGRFLTLDAVTGVGSLVGKPGPGLLPGLAISTRGEVYAMAFGLLYRIDVTSGAAVLVGDTGAAFIEGIAFDANDVLYAVSETANELYTIDVSTPSATRVGSLPTDSFVGLAFDPTNGDLYGSRGGGADDVWKLDKATGGGTLVGSTGFGGSTPDLHFDDTGQLFGVKGGGQAVNQLIRIDKSTGAGTIVGPIGFGAVSGLASNPAAVAVFVPGGVPLPTAFALHGARPNPFNPTTRIEFETPIRGRVALIVFDLTGRRVATLVDAVVEPGRHTAPFFANGLASGVYFFEMRAGGFREVRKMTLLR